MKNTNGKPVLALILFFCWLAICWCAGWIVGSFLGKMAAGKR